jgi:hypothetical protein
LRAVSSLNTRAFSIAIVACVAKVSSIAICGSENGPGSGRPTPIAPMARPCCNSGTETVLRKPEASAASPIR